MSIKVRFAPSPTGFLHVGNARIALINWLYAKKFNGKFLLRIDDTDTNRNKKKFITTIKKDLSWLKIDFDECTNQSERLEQYYSIINRLRQTGKLYPCYETEEELALKRKIQISKGRPPIYDRASLHITTKKKKELEEQGKKPHWRLLVEPNTIEWNDLIHGKITFNGNKISDPILIRENQKPTYTICSIIDDVELGITHIIRGEDLLPSTTIQIELLKALNINPDRFTFAHLPLIQNIEGNKLSKRLGSLSLANLREAGIEPMVINSFLAKLGSSDSISNHFDMDDLTFQFDIKKFSLSSPKFSSKELNNLNIKFLQNAPFELIKQRIVDLKINPVKYNFWEIIKKNLTKLDDINIWYKICYQQITPIINDKSFISQAAKLLPKAPWDNNTWKNWITLLKNNTNNKGKKLFLPIRLAITGLPFGPELDKLFNCIGYEKVYNRLHGKTA